MMLVLPTVIISIAIGYLRGGRLGNLAAVSLRGSWLLAVAVAAQATLALVSALDGPVSAVGLPLLASSHLALLAFMWLNRMLPGMILVFVGIAMNIAVIAANGAMPVSRDAIVAIAPDATFEPGKHRLLEEGDRLAVLADIFPLPLLRSVVSLGDVVLAAGVGILVVALMRADPGRHGRHSPLAAAMGHPVKGAARKEDEATA